MIRWFCALVALSACSVDVGINKAAMLKTNVRVKQDDAIHVPYVYDAAPGVPVCKEVNLFLSFDCHFCKESLQALADYLKKKPVVRAKLYFFTQEEEDKEKIHYLLAADGDLELISHMCQILLYERDGVKSKKFSQFLKEHAKVQENYQKNRAIYAIYRAAMQKKFFKARVDKTPTWVINEIVMIEGPVDDLAEVMATV